MRARGASPWGLAASLAVTAVLIARLFAFIDRNAVNVLYFDQWDFWGGLFRGEGLWDLFRWQHGPHRQGLDYLVIVACARLSEWDSRFEAFAIGAILVLASFLGLLLVRLLRGSWSIFDGCVPIIVLSLSQFETLIGTLNPAHGAVPLLCVLAYALALQIECRALQLAILLVLGFSATYTGFGFFLGLVGPAVLGLLLLGAIHRRQAIALHAAVLGLSLISLGSFFWGYHFQTGTEGLVTPHVPVMNYLRYLNVLFLRPFELDVVKPLKMGLGLPFLVGAVALVVWSGWRSVKSFGASRFHLTIFALSGFSLLFAMGLAAGRAPLGVGQASSSRYVPYLTPMLIAGYLALSLSSFQPRWRAALLALLMAGLAMKEAYSVAHGRYWIDLLVEGKRRWRACYLREGDVARCDEEARFQIYPAPEISERLRWELDYLREHHLNLFKPGP